MLWKCMEMDRCLWKCMDRCGDAAASFSHSGAVAAAGACSGSIQRSKLKFSHWDPDLLRIHPVTKTQLQSLRSRFAPDPSKPKLKFSGSVSRSAQKLNYGISPGAVPNGSTTDLLLTGQKPTLNPKQCTEWFKGQWMGVSLMVVKKNSLRKTCFNGKQYSVSRSFDQGALE